MPDRTELGEPNLTEEPVKGELAELHEDELEHLSGGIDSDNNTVGIAGSSTVFSFTGKG